MRDKPVKDVSASIRQKLLNLRDEQNQNFTLILNRYARERLLYRIGASSHCDRFILKGATLFTLWDDQPHRMTQDIDLLGIMDGVIPELIGTFQDICSISEGNDGLRFPNDEISGEEIREDQVYGGIRIKLIGYLGKMRIPLQVDIGFGDSVTPDAEKVIIPSLLGLPDPVLYAYPKETVIAEKAQAMVVLGIANSRMKDFYDLWTLSRNHDYEGYVLIEALRNTFARRQTTIPEELPIGLSEEFCTDTAKRLQWRAFLHKSGLSTENLELPVVIERLREFLWPPMEAARNVSAFPSKWSSENGWSSVRNVK